MGPNRPSLIKYCFAYSFVFVLYLQKKITNSLFSRDGIRIFAVGTKVDKIEILKHMNFASAVYKTPPLYS